MMIYDKKTLEDIMTDAKHGFSLSDIAIRLELDYELFIFDYRDEETEIKRYYEAGRTLGRVETDKTLYSLAVSGSALAKTNYDNKIKEAKLSDAFSDIFNT